MAVTIAQAQVQPDGILVADPTSSSQNNCDGTGNTGEAISLTQDDNTGNIGIGTCDWSANLTIQAFAKVSNTAVEIVAQNQRGNIPPYNNLDYMFKVHTLTPAGSGYTASDNPLLVVTDASQSVGIGTYTPLATLHVDNINVAQKTPALWVQNYSAKGNMDVLYADWTGKVGIDNSSPQAALYITNYNDGNGTPAFWVQNASSGDAMYIDPNGNVGIDNESPAFPLDVTGNANVSGTTSTVNFQMTAGAAAGYLMQSDGSGNGSWVDPTSLRGLNLWALASNGTDIYNTNTRNVGIGTNTPASTLSIVAPTAYVGTLTNVVNILNSPIAGLGDLGSGPTYTPNSFTINRIAGTSTLTDFIVSGSGNVGIGTATPGFALEVVGNVGISGGILTGSDAYIGGNTTLNGTLTTIGVANFSDNVNVSGNLAAYNFQMTNGSAAGYLMQSDAGGHASWVSQASVGAGLWAQSGTNIYNTNSNYVGIGTNSPQAALDVQGVVRIGNVPVINALTYTGTSGNGGYSLYVQYGVLAESFKIAPSTSPDWFDQVFDSSYALRPLADVAGYVKANHHLPEIPSADEVAKNGIDVAKMDGRLLQKVEELTLYVIQLKGEIEELKTAKK